MALSLAYIALVLAAGTAILGFIVFSGSVATVLHVLFYFLVAAFVGLLILGQLATKGRDRKRP